MDEKMVKSEPKLRFFSTTVRPVYDRWIVALGGFALLLFALIGFADGGQDRNISFVANTLLSLAYLGSSLFLFWLAVTAFALFRHNREIYSNTILGFFFAYFSIEAFLRGEIVDAAVSIALATFCGSLILAQRRREDSDSET